MPLSGEEHPKGRVLLVEDNDENRDMLARRLARRGWAILIAADGERGVDIAVAEQPDIILMDMSLPVLNGWEATRRLKSRPDTRSIPVIALTAHAMFGDREEALAAGCDEFETKPVELDALIAKMITLVHSNESKS